MSDAADQPTGRAAFTARAWERAYLAFAREDRVAPLSAADLERYAIAAYLTGRDEAYLAALERAHHAHVGTGAAPAAARCAFWIGLRLAMRGESGGASGWL